MLHTNKDLIRIENLVTGYGKHAITSNLNARLVAGELVSLLGRNGVGKSTLLRTLCGFQPPLGGRILLYGQDICTISQAGLSRKIGVVLTERPDTGNMTVREMVEMGRSPYTGFWGRLDRHDSETVQWAMRLAGIEDMQGRRVRTLSDGERQKTMIAKALAQETPIILLDEPTAFLDFQSKAETMRLLSKLAHEQRKVIFLSTHDVEMALQLSDRLWLMDKDGVTTGTPEALSYDGTISRFLQCKGMEYEPSTRTMHISDSV